MVKYIFARKLQNLLHILNNTKHVYDNNWKSEQQHYDLCSKLARIMHIIPGTTIFLYFSLAFFNTLPTIVDYFVNNNITPCFNVYFIGLIEPGRNVLIITNIYNLIMLIITMFTIATADILIYFTFLNIPLISLVIERRLKQLEDELSNCDNLSSRQIKQRLIDVILMNQIHIGCDFN